MADQKGSEITIATPAATGIVFGVVDPTGTGAATRMFSGPDLNPNISITAAETAAGITSVDIAFEPGDVRRYGGIENGVFDNSTALSNAIKVADESGEPVFIVGGDSFYNVTSFVIQATLSQPLTIIGIGRPEIRYSGSSTNVVLQITDTNGNDVIFENIIINGNLLAATCLRIDNPSVSMADENIGQVRIKDCTLENGLLKSGSTYSATGLTVIGGFSEVILDNLTVRNIDRDVGTGIPGSRGSFGVLIAFDDINAYVKKLTVMGGHIDIITNNETTGTGDDVDCDGIIHNAPTATDNSDKHLPVLMVCYGTKFSNCKGRLVKTQLDGFTIVRDFMVVRDLEEAINNARDFDLQRGGGIIDGGVMYVNEKSGGGSTWGTSHAIVSWSPDQLATSGDNHDGGLSVRDIKIYSGIPTATDNLPFFCLIDNPIAGRELLNFNMKDCAMIGGQIDRWVKIQSAGNNQDLNLTIEGCEGDTVTSLILFAATVDEATKLVVSKNRNTRLAGTPDLVEFSAGDSEPLLSAYNNTGYNVTYIGESVSSAMGEIFRPNLIGGDTRDGHVFATAQTISLADDATHAFSATGNFGIGIITSDFDDSTQAIFKHDSNSFKELFEAGVTSPSITFGTTTNPDIDGDLNVWITGNNTINIKNRLGQTNIFHFWHFGGG